MSRTLFVFCFLMLASMTFLIITNIERVFANVHQPEARHNLALESCLSAVSHKKIGAIVAVNTRSRASENYFQMAIRDLDGGVSIADCYPSVGKIQDIRSMNLREFVLL